LGGKIQRWRSAITQATIRKIEARRGGAVQFQVSRPFDLADMGSSMLDPYAEKGGTTGWQLALLRRTRGLGEMGSGVAFRLH
jgi:hypothetical protein